MFISVAAERSQGEEDQRAGRAPASHTDRRPIRFGRCEALPGARALLRAGRPVEIGSRAFDLLMILLHRRGELVTKDQIVRHVWPTTIVEESNLRFQMASLRRVLGEDRDLIKTVPGRGYLMIADDAPPVALIAREPESADVGRRESAIFIVEENPDLREALSRLLRPFSARVLSFRSLEALRAGGV